jgi:hypothetical protein
LATLCVKLPLTLEKEAELVMGATTEEDGVTADEEDVDEGRAMEIEVEALEDERDDEVEEELEEEEEVVVVVLEEGTERCLGGATQKKKQTGEAINKHNKQKQDKTFKMNFFDE